jgi:HNH endonuclease
MLRRSENVYTTHRTGMFTKKGPILLHIGASTYITNTKVPRDEYIRWKSQSSTYPIHFGTVGERAYWLFAERWYWDNENLSEQEVYALLVTREQRNRQRIARAQAIVAMQQAPTPTVRGAIPDDLKQYVWNRDGGRCRQCGSNVELQFDHVIPVAFGGATSPDNLQILCGPCNRRKGASIA